MIKPRQNCSPEVLAQIAEVIPVPVLISTFGGDSIFDHKIAFANSAFTQLTGFKNEHVIGRSPEFLCDRQADEAIMEFYNKCGYSENFEFELDSFKKSGEKIRLKASVVTAIEQNAAEGVKSFIITCAEMPRVQNVAYYQGEAEEFEVPVAPIIAPAPVFLAAQPTISDEQKRIQQELEIAREREAAFATAQQVAELQELMRQKQELQEKLVAKRNLDIAAAAIQPQNEPANDVGAPAKQEVSLDQFIPTDYDSIINEIVSALGQEDGQQDSEEFEAQEQTEARAEAEQPSKRSAVLDEMIESIKRKSDVALSQDAHIAELKSAVEDKAIEDEIDYYAKTKFLSNMSHDLRTPLNAIIGFSEVIRDQLFGPIDNQRYVSYANDIFKSGQELLGTITEILELSEIESEGSLELEEEQFDICETIDSVLDLLSAKAFQTDVRMLKSLKVSNIMMNGDRRKLKQAVGGIVGNAIKCSPSGGKIEVTSEIDENGDFKFITYLRSANLIATRASLGSLLGTVTNKVESEYPEISLAKRFTEAHDGKFSIFNSATSGTEITLTIPKVRLIDTRKAKLHVITN